MHPLPADVTDLVCQATDSAEHLAALLAVLAVTVVCTAWIVRDRVAVAGHQGPWALCSLLCAALHLIAALALVPMGCLTAHTVGILLGATAPWFVAAGLFRSGVAPSPPPLRSDLREPGTDNPFRD